MMGSDSGREEASTGPYWQVEIDGKRCSLCEVCARCCPRDALRSQQEGETLAILFSHQLCDGCGDCLKTCPEHALSLVEIKAPADGSGWKILAESDVVRCSACGARFAPVAKLEAASHRQGNGADLIREHCPLCRRTQMVATFIDEKREAIGKKAEYRTGKKWSWKPIAEGDPNGPPCSEVLDGPSDLDALTQGTSGEDSPATS